MPRHTLVRNPAIFAIVTSPSILHDKRFARIKCLRVNLETSLQIVRVHTLSPTISHFLLHCATGKLKPALVEESAEFVQARHPDKDGRRVGYHAETLFALAQLSLTIARSSMTAARNISGTDRT